MTTQGNTILFKGKSTMDEYRAVAALSPGHLVELVSTGKVQKHSTAGGRAARWFAQQNTLIGTGSVWAPNGTSITTAYAADDLVSVIKPERGTVIWAICHAGTAYAKGDKLVSRGDGTLEKESALSTTTLEKDTIAIVEEAVDLSVSGAVDGLVPVTII